MYSKLAVLRLMKNDKGETISIKKFIYYCHVASWEDGTLTGEFEWDSPTIYLVTDYEIFYISGKLEDFDKLMSKYITAIRKIDESYNSSE